MIRQLHPAYPVLWRSGGHIQVGFETSVVFEAPSRAVEEVLLALERGISDEDLQALAQRHSMSARELDGVLSRLGSRCQRAPSALGLHRLWTVPQDHALADFHHDRQRLGSTTVAVIGDGPLAAATLSLLAGSGITHLVHAPDPASGAAPARVVESTRRTPDGPSPWPAFDDWLMQALDCTIGSTGPETADISVICSSGPPHPSQWIPLLRADQPHLSVWSAPSGGVVVGPFVVPGRTGCLGCMNQHARDCVPDWALLCDQLWRHPRIAPLATDIARASALAAQAIIDAITMPSSHHDETWNQRVLVHGAETHAYPHVPHASCLCRDDFAGLDALAHEPGIAATTAARSEMA